MKIVLSRKGFDTQYGKQPSPILQDGSLLSLPIPAKNEEIRYTELFYEGKSYYQIIKELSQKSVVKENWNCHLDPDIRPSSLKRKGQWKPIFGQSDTAQGHLDKEGVSKNDIFLFFGWFREAKYLNGKYSYIEGSPDLHVIFAYFQIGEIYKKMDNLPEFATYHPHARENFTNRRNNCIYIANSNLSLNQSYDGASMLNYNENLILTKRGLSKSKWELPEMFKNLNISYHYKDSFKEDYFQSAAKGQEFVIDANDDLIEWALDLIQTNPKS
jgi:hypothetical protein